MKALLILLLTAMGVVTAAANEGHVYGYATGIAQPDKYEGQAINIKVGGSLLSPHNEKTLHVPKKEGYTCFEIFPAYNHDPEKLAACATVIRAVYVSDIKLEWFKKTHCKKGQKYFGEHPTDEELEHRVNIELDGLYLNGVLWKINDQWVLVIK